MAGARQASAAADGAAAHPGGRLSRAEAAAWAEDGFLVRRGVFTAAEAAALGDAVERAAERARQQAAHDGRTYWLDGKRFVDVGHRTLQFEHAPDAETLRVIEPVHDLDDALRALVADPRLLQPMRDLVGSERLALWTDKLNLKRPREGSGFGWHQDSPYWVHACGHVDRLPNVMVVLDDATEENGCLRVIRGSHRAGCLPGSNDGTQLGGFFTDPEAFDESAQVPLNAPAGSLLFFSPHAVHGSRPNESSLPRRALVITYQPADHPALKSGQVLNLP